MLATLPQLKKMTFKTFCLKRAHFYDIFYDIFYEHAIENLFMGPKKPKRPRGTILYFSVKLGTLIYDPVGKNDGKHCLFYCPH